MINKDYIDNLSHDSSRKNLKPVPSFEFLEALETAYGKAAVEKAYQFAMGPLKNPEQKPSFSTALPFAKRIQDGLLNNGNVGTADQVYLAQLVQSYVGQGHFWKVREELAQALDKRRITVQS